MTPTQIQQKLNELRAQKNQIDADLSSMASSVEDALKPIRENRSKLKQYWGKWQAASKAISRERWVGDKKGETRMRVIWQLRLGKETADAYVDAWEAAPKAVQNLEELIGDLISANDRLQQAKTAVLGVQIPPSVSSPSQLTGIKTALNNAKTSSNQAIDAARAILSNLPSRRSKIKPLISAALKMTKSILERLKMREDKLEDRKIAIFKKLRLQIFDRLQKVIKPYHEMAQKLLKEADEFVDGAPAREQAIKSKQAAINSKISLIQSGLSFAPGGSSNRPEADPGDAVLHILAIGAVAAGICAFDHYEHQA
jgi:chromosome segregation ATPase